MIGLFDSIPEVMLDLNIRWFIPAVDLSLTTEFW